MSNYKEGLDSILQAINNLISPQLVNLRYDKTFRGKITNVIDNGLYEVQINGKTYTLPYAGTLQVNDIVKVKSPLNNFSDIYIEAIGGSGGSGGTSNYNDLTNKPILNTNYTSSLTPNSTEVIRGTINLHKVSKTGKYSDLIGVPSLDFISTSQKGVAGGVATLGDDGKVPSTQLPDGIVIDSSYVHTDNNFTTALLTKLNGIEEGAQVNKIETISRNGVTLPITNKNVDIEVPTKTSDLQNDSNFITPDNIIAGNNITLEKDGNNIKINSTGGGGTGTEEVDISETEPTDTGIKLWVDLSDTPSPSGDFTYRYARTFTETIPGGSTIDLPIKYVVGSQLMDVYYNGELLVLSSDEAGTDGSYLEIGAEKSYSTQIKITTDWEIYSGDYMEIVMRRHPWDASGIEVIDNLTSTSAVDALSANMGRELEDKLEGKANIGNIIVDGINSKNMLKISASDTTVNGVSFVFNEDGSVTLNGTSTANSALTISQQKISEPGSYVFGITTDFSGIGHGFEVGGYIYDKDGSYKENLSTATGYKVLSNEDYLSNFFIYFQTGATFDNFTIYPQLEKGETSTDYSRYFNVYNPNVLNSGDIIYFVPTNVENYLGYGNCYYYKIGSKIHLHVGVKITATTNVPIYTLPEKYRPITTIGVVGLGDSLSSYSTMQINEQGLVSINSQSGYALIDTEYDTLN